MGLLLPLKREIVIGPLQEEIAEYKAETTRLQKEFEEEEAIARIKLADYREEIARTKLEWERNRLEFRSRLKQSLEAARKSQKSVSTIFFYIAGGLGLAGLIFYSSAISNKGDGAIGCAFSLALMPAIIGFLLHSLSEHKLASTLNSEEAREQRRVDAIVNSLTKHIADTEAYWIDRRGKIAERTEKTRLSVRNIEESIMNLEGQIPEYPNAEQVNSWFLEELEEMQSEFLRESGQEGRLARVRSGKNVFCIRGPAELQPKDQIEKVYLETENLKKHLHARRAGVTQSGEMLALYGVWIIEFLFLGEDELTSFRVFYDFIAKRKSTRSRVHNYNAVALIETRSQFRVIEIIPDGEKESKQEIVDDVPSLFFALENGERIEINFTNAGYLAKVLPELQASAKLLYEPKLEAIEALRVLRENVHNARTRSRGDNVDTELL